MRQLLIIIIGITIIFSACKSKSTDSKIAEKVDYNPADTTQFFPVTDFIEGQILEIKTGNLNPLHILISGEKRDSSWVKMEDVDGFAKDFLSPIIDPVNLKEKYDQARFNDQSLDAFTFSYDLKKTLPDSIKLKHWDVYIDPKTSKVRRIFMVKEDKNTLTQLTWETDKWFRILKMDLRDSAQKIIHNEYLQWKLTDSL